jgi:hypothetical protein
MGRISCLSISSLLAIGLHMPSCALAVEDGAFPAFSLGGFGTVGMVYNGSNGADFLRDLSQSKGAGYSRRVDLGVDSLLGLQADVTLTPSLGGAVQLISHRRHDGSFMPEATWAFAKYAPSDNFQVRIGRLGFDVHMLADSRSIGYSYVSIRPPVEYFGSLPLSYFNGADLALKHPLGDGIARAKIYAGVAQEKIPTRISSDVFDLKGSPLIGAYAELQRNEWQYRIGYAEVRFKNDLFAIMPLLAGLRSPFVAAISPEAARFAADASVADKRYGFFSAGAAYDSGPLQLQLVLSRQRSESLTFPSNIAGYISLAYRIGRWTPHIAYSSIRTQDPKRSTGLPGGVSPALDALITGAQQLQQGNSNTQHTWTMGVRYDFTSKTALKIQLDQIRADAPLMWANRQADWNGRATLFSAALDFVF